MPQPSSAAAHSPPQLAVEVETDARADALQLLAAPAQLSASEREAIADVQAQRRAPNTRRAYESSLRSFRGWCQQRDATALPAHPSTIAAYLTERAAQVGVGALRLALSAIRAAHLDAQLDDPTSAPDVRATIAGLVRIRSVASKQAVALSLSDIGAIRAVARRPRRLGKRRDGDGQPIYETEAAAQRRGAVDSALVETLFWGLLRRSEAAALRWSDLFRETDGGWRLAIRRSKTDQTGEGAVVFIPQHVAALLLELRSDDASDDDSIFGLSASQVGRRVKAAAAAAGLGDGYSGHSGRVGMATALVERGESLAQIQLDGRWADPRMPARYARSLEAGRGAVARFAAQTGSS